MERHSQVKLQADPQCRHTHYKNLWSWFTLWQDSGRCEQAVTQRHQNMQPKCMQGDAQRSISCNSCSQRLAEVKEAVNNFFITTCRHQYHTWEGWNAECRTVAHLSTDWTGQIQWFPGILHLLHGWQMALPFLLLLLLLLLLLTWSWAPHLLPGRAESVCVGQCQRWAFTGAWPECPDALLSLLTAATQAHTLGDGALCWWDELVTRQLQASRCPTAERPEMLRCFVSSSGADLVWARPTSRSCLWPVCVVVWRHWASQHSI